MMKDIRIGDELSGYAAKWGLTDFYDDSKQKLIEVLNSGENFRTSYGCRKEIRYAEIIRDENGVYVEVAAYMDSLYDGDDLIYDALWERCGVEEEVEEELIDRIRYLADFYDVYDLTVSREELSREATFDDICEAIEGCEKDAELRNTNMFERLCNIAEECYFEMKGA